MARRHGLTSYHFLLSAFYVWLGRLSGQEDVVVGVPAAGQLGSLEAAGRVGYAVNVLPLRARPEGTLSFVEHAKRVRRSLLGGLEHQDFSLPGLVNRLLRGRDPSRPPLFSVVFNVDRGGEDVFLGDLRVEFESTPTGGVKFELDVNLTLEPEKLRAECVFDRDLFDRVTIESWFAALERLLASIAEDPGRRLSEVSLLSGPERVQVLESWNATAVDYPPACLHELVSAQAARTPEAAAVVFEDRSLTYAELDGAANRLAHHLRSLGVGPEVRVALCAERSRELVVGILGILAAGGVYVPVDPAYPAERIAYLLEDSGCAAVLVQEELRATLPATGVAVLSLEEALSDTCGDEVTPAAVSPHNAAYVIYTSGSTGRPKGVVVTHANVVRLFKATEEWFGFGPDDVWTLFHSYAFDFSVWEIWGALLHGGRLVGVPWETSRDPEAFHRLLVHEGVTVLNQTPSAFRQLAAADEARGGSSELALRWVVFGGEALEPRTLRGWMERHGEERPRLVNMYGITETTVHVTFRPVGRADVEAGAASPIGVQIPDLGVRVLDRRGSPVPVGVPGELYVG
ncbi:MAG TPA: amino acid adenylation domain-containing protein, partial [Longimicrobiaceae bacterium]|nr:amino acid adenylation domain-containing protein [Longimicrobiaceae bacterium]